MPIARSHNNALRKAYFAALNGITYSGNEVPVYADMAPDNPGSLYITFSDINNTDNSPKSAITMNTTIQVSIYSNNVKYGNATAVDEVADEVLQRITAGVGLTGFQNVSTEIANDNTQPYFIQGQNVAIDRLITFRHIIFQGIS